MCPLLSDGPYAGGGGGPYGGGGNTASYGLGPGGGIYGGGYRGGEGSLNGSFGSPDHSGQSHVVGC
jgi:hypothetical protein